MSSIRYPALLQYNQTFKVNASSGFSKSRLSNQHSKRTWPSEIEDTPMLKPSTPAMTATGVVNAVG
jgi:hypothetical protein